jgi:hypothetical protein
LTGKFILGFPPLRSLQTLTTIHIQVHFLSARIRLRACEVFVQRKECVRLQLPERSTQLLLNSVDVMKEISPLQGKTPATELPVRTEQEMKSENLVFQFIQDPFRDEDEVGAMYSSSFNPHDFFESLPGRGSSETRLMYFSFEAHVLNLSKQAQKIALKTQWHEVDAPPRPSRRPNPKHIVHDCWARARFSVRVYCMFAHLLTAPRSTSRRASIR